MLSDAELLRYSRQILLSQIDIEGQLRLKQGRALIIGLGGLGSPVALYLAAAGVGELHLADFDTVDKLEEQLDWDERIYRDRAKSLTYVCETPVLLEKRLFALAQILQKFVSD